MNERSAVVSWFDVPRKYVPAGLKKTIRKLQTKLQTLVGPYYCPVCESRVGTFYPLPNFFLSNAQKYGFPFSVEDSETCNHEQYSCPLCEASDRERLYALFLRDYIKNHKTPGLTEIVDFAPSAPLSNCLRKLIKETHADISYRTADFFADGIDDRVDIMDMGVYEDQRFDFFICSHVLEHVADDRKALKELYRILKSGGKGILMVPIVLGLREIDEDPTIIDEAERWRRFGQFDHVRLYSKSGFLDRVRDAGFLVKEYSLDSFGKKVFRRNGITNKSILYVVEK